MTSCRLDRKGIYSYPWIFCVRGINILDDISVWESSLYLYCFSSFWTAYSGLLNSLFTQ
jgi:hypothetical protein